MTTSSRTESPVRLVLCAETAADLMEPCVVSLPGATTLKEAAAFLAGSGLTAVPVVDEAGGPVGVLSQSDIVSYHRGGPRGPMTDPALHVGTDRASGPVRMIWTDCDVLEADSVPVRDLMTPVVFSVPADTPAWKVIMEMLARKVHQLFVVDDDGGLVGFVSTVDVLRHLRPDWEAPGLA